MKRKQNQYSQISKKELLKATYNILRDPEIPYVLKKDFLKDKTIQIWSEHFVTEPNSKIIGNKYISEGAYQEYLKTKSAKGLHHEHVTTKNLLYTKHFGNHYMEAEIDELENWLESCAFACVITKGPKGSGKEDETYLGGSLRQHMPDEFYDKNSPLYMKKWARYLKSGFTDIWEVKWENKIPLKVGRPNFDETI